MKDTINEPLINNTNVAEVKSDSLFKQIIQLSSVTILNQMLVTANLFVGAIALSGLGNDGLNASGFITPITLTFLNASTGIIRAVGVKTGEFSRKKETHKDIGKIFQQGLKLALITSVITSALNLATPKLFESIEGTNGMTNIMEEFLYRYAMVIPANILLNTFQDLTLAIGDKKSVIVSGILSQCLGALFGYFLVLGKFGMPNLGAAGFVYANAASTWIINLFYYMYLKIEKFKNYNLFSKDHENGRAALKEMWSIGWPIGVMIFIERVVLLGCAFMSSNLSKNALAAQEITSQYLFFLIVAMYGLSRGLGIVVSKSKSLAEQTKISNYGIGLATILSALVSIGYNIFPNQLISAFSSDSVNDQVISFSKSLFIVNAVGGVIDSARIVTNGCLRGFKETTFSLKVTAAFMLPSLALSYGLGQTNAGVNGIFIGRNIGVLFCLGTVLGGLNNLLNGIKSTFPPKIAALKNCFICCATNNNKPDDVIENGHQQVQRYNAV